MQIGYARVSTVDQTTAPQEDQLRAAGCERIFCDVISGSKAKRPGLDDMIAQARRGDVIVVVRLDRLGRSLVDLVKTIQQLKAAGVGFRSISEQIDTTTAGGKLIFHIFGSLAEFERTLIQERTHAGLASARARGNVGGRPRDTDTRRQAMAASMLADPANTVQDVCRVLRVSRATAYRLARKGQRTAQVQPPAAKPPRNDSKPLHAPSKPARTAKTPEERDPIFRPTVDDLIAETHYNIAALEAERPAPLTESERQRILTANRALLARLERRTRAAVSSPKQPTKSSKTPTTPAKGQKTTNSSRRKP